MILTLWPFLRSSNRDGQETPKFECGQARLRLSELSATVSTEVLKKVQRVKLAH